MKVIVKSPSGPKFELSTDKTAITIGRSSKCDLVIADESLSRQHALIEHDQENFYITDLGSSNGVYLDGERIPPNVRTQFTTFLQLSLASLDCQVTADEPEFYVPPPPTPGRPPKHEHTATRKLSSSLSSKSKTKDKGGMSAGVKISLLALVGILGVLGYRIITDESGGKDDPGKLTQVITERNVPEPLKTIPDRFLTEGEYKVIEETINCDKHSAACRELGLRMEHGEGINEKDGEVFIYFSAVRRGPLPEYQKILGLPEADMIIGLHHLLQTGLFKKFQAKEFGQIHMVLMSPQLEHQKVLRFHAKNFATNGFERESLLVDIKKALTFKDLGPLLKSTRTLVQIKEL